MQRKDFHLATSDPFPILFIVLAMLGATLIIIASVFLLDGVDLVQLGKFLELAVPGGVLIGLGLRKRLVWVSHTGEVVITWGNRCALPIHRYTAEAEAQVVAKRLAGVN